MVTALKVDPGWVADVSHVKAACVPDDSNLPGASLAAVSQAQAEKGIDVLKRDWLDPKAVDHAVSFADIRLFSPGRIYRGAVPQAAVKLVEQSRHIVPILAGSSGVTSPP